MHSLILVVALAGLPMDVTTAAPSARRTQVATGVSLLAVGWAASVANTSVAWGTCTAHLSCYSYTALALPFGIAVSATPIVGPTVGLISDLAMGVYRDETAFWVRNAVNLAALAMQVTGFVMLLTVPRTPKPQQPFAVTGFGAAPLRDGASVGFSGSFELPH